MPDLRFIDINCDVGEGITREAGLFPYISSCSIACGGHAGDARTMQSSIELALRHLVKIGAHPSYPDKENFGRITISIPPDQLEESIHGQVSTLAGLVAKMNVALSHIKPHGALYNDMTSNRNLAELFLRAVVSFRSKCSLILPPSSIVMKLALEEGFDCKVEAFADRRYNDDLSLVSRSHPKAVISDPEEVLDQVLFLIEQGMINSINGNSVPIVFDTICIHGDNPNAQAILSHIFENLDGRCIKLKK